MKKNGFIISTTLYGIFGIMMITVFYILYILGTNRTVVNASTAQVKKEIETYKYDKVYVNFLGSKDDLNSKVPDSSIDALVKELESKNIYMEYDKSFTDTESIAANDNNAPYYQNIIVNKILEFPGSDPYDLSTTFKTNDIPFTCNDTNHSGFRFLGITNNKYMVFMESSRYSSQRIRIRYTFVDIYNTNNKKQLYIESISEVSFSPINYVNSYFKQTSNDSIEICLELQKNSSNYYRKIITFNYDDSSYNINSSSNTRCGSSYSELENYTEDTSITSPSIGGYYASDGKTYSCNYDICFNYIDDLDTYLYEAGLGVRRYFSSKGNLFVNQSSNVKRYGDVITVEIPREIIGSNRQVVSKCEMKVYMVWYPPNYDDITTNVKVFKLDTTNKDPNIKYLKQYYVFVSKDDNKDDLGISRIKFEDTLNETLNNAINTKSLIFSDNPYGFPVTNNVTTYIYNTNVLNQLESQINIDLE